MAQTSSKKSVLYCGVCSLPPEYCEFSASRKACEQWLKERHPSEHLRLYSEQALAEKLTQTTLSAEKELKEAAKMEKAINKEEARAARAKEKLKASRIIIKRVERNKRKSVTSVFGMDIFHVDLKKMAKVFANHFACGASVSKNAQGLDEIVVQGDFSDEILAIIRKQHPEIPADNIDLVEEKKSKAATTEAA
ncbi:Translation machinery-associated protein 22 [Coemansia sp. Benny D115]|nr:Translation machinery-associated protein 22 [Coemansia sp. Benny D115]